MRFASSTLWTLVFCALMTFAIANESISNGLGDVNREIHIGSTKKLCEVLFGKVSYTAWRDYCGDTDAVIINPYSLRASDNSETDMYEYEANPKLGYHKSSGKTGGFLNDGFNDHHPLPTHSILESLRAAALLQALQREKLTEFNKSEIPAFFRDADSSSPSNEVGNKSRRDDQGENHPLYLI